MGLLDGLENLGEIAANIVKAPVAVGRDLVGLVTDDSSDLLPRTGELVKNTGDRIDELVKPNPVKKD